MLRFSAKWCRTWLQNLSLTTCNPIIRHFWWRYKSLIWSISYDRQINIYICMYVIGAVHHWDVCVRFPPLWSCTQKRYNHMWPSLLVLWKESLSILGIPHPLNFPRLIYSLDIAEIFFEILVTQYDSIELCLHFIKNNIRFRNYRPLTVSNISRYKKTIWA